MTCPNVYLAYSDGANERRSTGTATVERRKPMERDGMASRIRIGEVVARAIDAAAEVGEGAGAGEGVGVRPFWDAGRVLCVVCL